MAPLSNKEVALFYFTRKPKTSEYTCKCGTQRKCEAGYENLMTHIRTKHKNFEIEINSSRQSVLNVFIDPKAKNIFGWLEWVIMNGFPFSFTTDPLNRFYSNLKRISRNTFMKYMSLVTSEVEKEITKVLPCRIGLLLDGWTDMSTSTHYLAIFAVYQLEGVRQTVLLAFSPLLDETNFNAENHVEFITYTLSLFNKSTEDVIFLVCDNEPLNKRIANILQKPMIGCNSHRLNLAVKKYLENFEPLLRKTNNLMKKLCSQKQSGKLRQSTKLRPVVRNDTRWWSTFALVSRYFELIPHIDKSDPELVIFLLSLLEEIEMKKIHQELKKFDSVSKKIQSESINLFQVRTLFEEILSRHSMLGQYLGLEDNSISLCPKFENAIAKFIEKNGEVDQRVMNELSGFPSSDDSVAVLESEDFAESVLAAKQPKLQKIMELKWVPSTSDHVERLFSQVKYVYNDHRKKLEPTNLENQMFLKANSNFWNLKLVNVLVTKHGDKNDNLDDE